ncbi:MAG: aminotransferase class I/II-fold pyridoxal phosphate-dependent enzyme, partial [Chlorobi bacterium]|nr:aminotransferase class I/II-fold pyridoxal phosphate-dependent enzyme [Chlorobiota bacterium]
NPHNPTGKVYSREELEFIAGLARRFDFLVLSDEVYEFLTYDDAVHVPMATLPGMRERTITVSSMGKTFGMTGWKLGFAAAAPSLTGAIQKVHQFVTFAVNTPGQHAMAHALGRLESYLPEFRASYLRRRDFLLEGLKETIFRPHTPMGSYFVMVDIPADLGEDDVACAMRLVRDHGVAVIPPSAFYGASDEGRTMLRLCFAKKEETLKEGMEKLRSIST